MIGPAVAGVLVATIGEGLCFVINGLSFIAVIGCLLSMKLTFTRIKPVKTSYIQGLKEGVSYASRVATLKYIIMLIAFTSLVAMPYTVLMPVFATDIFNGDASTLGMLMTASGLGAMIGAIYLASRTSVKGLHRIIVVATLTFGGGLILFSLFSSFLLALACMVLVGFGMVTQMASCNTILQTTADDDKRGRIMSFYVMAFMGLSPFGSLLAGSLAEVIGAPFTLMSGGICCLLGGLIFNWKLSAIQESENLPN